MKTALVIGAGPAGLMAAEELSRAGVKTIVAEAKPSPARKLLMAGKSGLNLTRDEPLDAFLARYPGAPDFLKTIIAGFGPGAVQDWARALGQELFTGSTGRVFPTAMKASPLLRAWLARLAAQGVELRGQWRWTGWQSDALTFTTPDGPKTLHPDVTVLALGGASWPRLGSDGGWVPLLAAKGVEITPLRPANAGIRVKWSDHMTRHFGAPVKSIRLTAGPLASRGEIVISSHGIEGGGLYAVFAAIRDGALLTLDLLPDLTTQEIARRLARPRGKASLSNHLRKTLKLDPTRIALMQEFARPLPDDPGALAMILKTLPIAHDGPRPIEEAISTAGGIALSELDDSLMLKRLPGLYAAGEMLDWEAPTGGYLITACLGTGRHAGQCAAERALR